MQVLTQRSSNEIGAALLDSNPIVPSTGGFRARNLVSTLKLIKKKSKLAGITRLADLSHISEITFPVFQCTRPNIMGHSSTGQNTGSQGKGLTATQAKISCLMEGLEMFCLEPRESFLLRSDFKSLIQKSKAIDPQKFQRSEGAKKCSQGEALMWTKAYSVRDNCEVLVPAEAVYFPFDPAAYKTRSLFAQNSNGVAAGSCYSEATLHALFEAIERHYIAELADGKALAEEVDTDLCLPRSLKKKLAELEPDFQMQIFALRGQQQKDMPCFLAVLQNENFVTTGFGCSSKFELAIERAFCEAIQSYVTIVSASREDLTDYFSKKNNGLKFKISKAKKLSLKDLKSAYPYKPKSKIQAELKSVLTWLASIGCHECYIVNLNRLGIDIPVVRVLVPGLRIPRFAAGQPRPSQLSFESAKYEK